MKAFKLISLVVILTLALSAATFAKDVSLKFYSS